MIHQSSTAAGLHRDCDIKGGVQAEAGRQDEPCRGQQSSGGPFQRHLLGPQAGPEACAAHIRSQSTRRARAPAAQAAAEGSQQMGQKPSARAAAATAAPRRCIAGRSYVHDSHAL